MYYLLIIGKEISLEVSWKYSFIKFPLELYGLSIKYMIKMLLMVIMMIMMINYDGDYFTFWLISWNQFQELLPLKLRLILSGCHICNRGILRKSSSLWGSSEWILQVEVQCNFHVFQQRFLSDSKRSVFPAVFLITWNTFCKV